MNWRTGTQDEPNFCPCCGAHPMEHGEGTTPQALLSSWRQPLSEALLRVLKQDFSTLVSRVKSFATTNLAIVKKATRLDTSHDRD